MALKVVNFNNYQIEMIFSDNRVMGFKVYSRYYDNTLGRKRNYDMLEEFGYFTDAARFVAELSFSQEEKQQTCVYFLTEFYSEGEFLDLDSH